MNGDSKRSTSGVEKHESECVLAKVWKVGAEHLSFLLTVDVSILVVEKREPMRVRFWQNRTHQHYGNDTISCWNGKNGQSFFSVTRFSQHNLFN